MSLLTCNSEGLDSPQSDSKAESVSHDESNHEEVPSLQPPDVPNYSPIRLVRDAKTHWHEPPRYQGSHRPPGETEHLDYFEQLVPADKPSPKDKKYIYHLENIAGQLLLAGWQPLANQFYSLVFLILEEPQAYVALVKEVRDAFTDYGAINNESTAGLKYLQACAYESFRLHQDTVDGLPRVSPGAVVDGAHIPKGVSQVNMGTLQVMGSTFRSYSLTCDPVR